MILGEPLKRIQKYAKYGWSWAQAKKRQLIICFHSQTQTKLPKKELLKKTSK